MARFSFISFTNALLKALPPSTMAQKCTGDDNIYVILLTMPIQIQSKFENFTHLSDKNNRVCISGGSKISFCIGCMERRKHNWCNFFLSFFQIRIIFGSCPCLREHPFTLHCQLEQDRKERARPAVCSHRLFKNPYFLACWTEVVVAVAVGHYRQWDDPWLGAVRVQGSLLVA